MWLHFRLAGLLAAALFLSWALVPRALASPPRQTPTARPIVVNSQSVEMRFPRSMRFNLEVSSRAPITSLVLTVWQRGVALGSRNTPRFTSATRVQTAFDWNFQSFGDGGYLPPGTRGEYTWQIQDSAGNMLDTPRQEYLVEDRSQTWQTLSNADLQVNWYDGDARFGQAILNRATTARDFLSQQLRIEKQEPLQVYIYANKQDFFASLPPFSAEWTGGRTFPEYGVIMLNFAPDLLDWGLRATSHELSHAVLHTKIRGTLGDLSVPLWLDEGLAVYNETDDHAPDPQFEQTFQQAVRRNTLIPLKSLQLRFPPDAAQAELAYGQGYSAVKFMIENFGAEKFAQLLNIAEQGANPDDALLQVYGLNQDSLENAWRAKLGVALRDVSAAGLPTAAPRPTYEFSSPLTPVLTTPGGSAQDATATPAPTQIGLNATPPPAAPLPAQAPAAPTSALCGGALALGGFLMLAGWKRRRG